jgi:hypothetical protein
MILENAAYQRNNNIYLNCRTNLEFRRAVSVLEGGILGLGLGTGCDEDV